MDWNKLLDVVSNHRTACVAACVATAFFTFGQGRLDFIPSLSQPWSSLPPIGFAFTLVLNVIWIVGDLRSYLTAMWTWMRRPTFKRMTSFEKVIMHWFLFHPGESFHYVAIKENLPPEEKLDFQLAVDNLRKQDLIWEIPVIMAGISQYVLETTLGRLFIQKYRRDFDLLKTSQDKNFKRWMTGTVQVNNQVNQSRARL